MSIHRRPVRLDGRRAFGIVREVDDVVWRGSVACPSGELVLLDADGLSRWSGRGIPLDLDGQWADAEIIGPDAVTAAQAFHRQPVTMLYDIPRHARDRYAGLFTTLAGGLDATLRVLDEQVPHRDRVRRALTAGDPGFTILGSPVITIGNVPDDRPLPIYRTHARLWVAIRPGNVLGDPAPAAAVRDLGAVGVDSGLLAFADADALPRAAAIAEVGTGFLAGRLELDANGDPRELTLSIEAI